MKLRRFVLSAALLAPAALYAHPGHSVIDPAAGAPHAGHLAEWIVLAGCIGLAALASGIHALLRRDR